MSSESELRRQRAEHLKGTRESRGFAASFEVRDDAADGSVVMIGHASVTDHDYDVGSFRERIARGAFRRTLGQQPAVVLLANHEGLPLASTRGGSLALEEDDRGLRFTARMDPTDPDVDRVVRKVRRGDLTDASFAFRVTDDEWSEDGRHRLIRSLELHQGDVSVVVNGANPLATVAVRSAVVCPLPDRTTRARERLAVLMGEAKQTRSAVAEPWDYPARLARLRAA